MNSLLVDHSTTPDVGQGSADGGQAGSSTPPGSGEPLPAAAPGRTCAECDAPLGDGQQWCLHCGAAQPGSIGDGRGWRPLSTLALAALLLAVAAAAAGAAALTSHESTPPAAPLTVAQVPAATPPASTQGTTTTPALPTTPSAASTPTKKVPPVPKASAPSNQLFPSTSKPPKIPSATGTPTTKGKSTTTTPTGSQGSPSESETGTTPSEAKSPSGGEGSAEGPSAILLDTNAASTYNPYKYPEAGFGDPALAIDGEATTAWTAQIQPSSAPLMAEGLLLDLNTPTRLGSIEIVSMTPGMTVQIYGANGKQAPTSITEPGWTPLSASRVLKKKTAQFKLSTASRSFRFVVVWIVKAPASAVGTAQAPGHVDLNEVELFPPSS